MTKKLNKDKKKSYSRPMTSIKMQSVMITKMDQHYRDMVEKGVVCARLKNGEGYHYTHSYTWY